MERFTRSTSTRRPAAFSREQAGFSLLEAIVALTVVGIVGTVLFTWAAATQQSLARVQEANARQEAALNALEFVRTVNPMLRPQGEQTLGTYQLLWSAQPLEPERDMVGYPTGTGLYRVALYQMQVVLARDDAPQWHRFEVKQVGYRRVRDASFLLPP